MVRTPRQSVAEVADDLFDRYVLPKVALTVILLASLLGTGLSMHLSGTASPVVVLAKWSYFVAVSTLGGGLLWKHGFVRPTDLDSGAEAYCERMYDRFDRIAAGAVVLLAVSGPVVLFEYERALGASVSLVVLGVTLGGLLLAMGVSVVHHRSIDEAFRSASGLAALGLTVGVIVLTGFIEVQLRGGGVADTVVRAMHLLAFAGWIGGAVWNIFVAVPTGQEHRTVPVIEAAGQQLERFRWAVRLIIPLLVVTGVYQAIDALGYAVGTYVGSLAGLAVLGKLGFIAVLVVIFKLCPMWRACSPIEGICDLEELNIEEQPSSEAVDDG
jgi:uncharacterized membrane protein